ncbi:MAG: hypothetical protein QOK36_2551 [Gaiellales bacterium]|nr:hypothetical protein [Gaiellales bacterium]
MLDRAEELFRGMKAYLEAEPAPKVRLMRKKVATKENSRATAPRGGTVQPGDSGFVAEMPFLHHCRDDKEQPGPASRAVALGAFLFRYDMAGKSVMCVATLTTVPLGSRTKNRRMPHGSSVSG